MKRVCAMLWPLIANDRDPGRLDWPSVVVLIMCLGMTAMLLGMLVMGWWMVFRYGIAGPGAVP